MSIKCRITKVKDNSKKGIIGEANAVGKLEGINDVDEAGRIKGIKGKFRVMLEKIIGHYILNQ